MKILEVSSITPTKGSTSSPLGSVWLTGTLTLTLSMSGAAGSSLEVGSPAESGRSMTD